MATKKQAAKKSTKKTVAAASDWRNIFVSYHKNYHDSMKQRTVIVLEVYKLLSGAKLLVQLLNKKLHSVISCRHTVASFLFWSRCAGGSWLPTGGSWYHSRSVGGRSGRERTAERKRDEERKEGREKGREGEREGGRKGGRGEEGGGSNREKEGRIEKIREGENGGKGKEIVYICRKGQTNDCML